MTTPLLSIVIPTRNRRGLLEQALRSCLGKLPFPHEILVSDNHSSDSTPEVAALFPGIRYLRQAETLPMAEHWNLCVSEAKGKYVKLLCDDDWLLPGALVREVAMLDADPSLSLVASAREEVSADGKEVLGRKGPCARGSLSGRALWWKMLVDENFLGPPSAVTFRKSAFRGFPPDYAYAADWAAWVRLAEQGGVGLLPEPGCAFRLHATNLTNLHVEDGTDFVEVMALRREALARLRGVEAFAGRILYGMIFWYRLKRRLARLALRGRSPFPFLARAWDESRPRL